MKQTLTILAAIAGCDALAHAQGYSFVVLDSGIDNSTARAIAYAISGDGQVIGGGDTRYQDGEQPFIWRKSNGVWVRTQLPVPAAGSGTPQNRGRAMTMSFSGDVIGGMAGNRGILGTPNYSKPAVWTNVLSGQATLAVIDVPELSARAVSGVSAAGDKALWWGTTTEVLPGQAIVIRGQLWTWDAVTGLSTPRAPLSLPADPSFSTASLFSSQCLSGDGRVFAMRGASNFYSDASIHRPFLWVDGALQELPASLGRLDAFVNSRAGPNRVAHALSADGSTIVGFAIGSITSNASTIAIRWSFSGAVEVLGPIVSIAGLGPNTMALDVNADGQIIVGSRYFGAMPYAGSTDQVRNARAVYWLNSGHRVLANVLVAEGVDLGGVIPAVITGVSDNGSVMVGYGMSSDAADATLVSFVATILPPGVCDDIDFNRDGSRFDPVDIDAFLSVYSEGPCLPAGAQCRDIDFNNDGSLFDPRDIEAFLSVFGEGPCL